MGRRDDRLSPAADRQPVVHAQPRGGREGAGGGHPLRRGPDAARDRGRRATATRSASTVSAQHNDGDGVWHEYARATLPARTILVAAGTQPNTVLAREDAGALRARRQVLPAARRGRRAGQAGARPRQARATRGAHRHSRRRARDELLRRPASVVLRQRRQGDGEREAGLSDRVADARAGRAGVARRATPQFFAHARTTSLRATVARVVRLTPTIVEVVVRAPAAARRFRPGQFYRLQNFESLRAARATARGSRWKASR